MSVNPRLADSPWAGALSAAPQLVCGFLFKPFLKRRETMRRSHFFRTTALLLSFFFLPHASSAQVTRADYERAAGLRTKYQGLAVNIVDRPTWIGKTNHFWYRKS